MESVTQSDAVRTVPPLPGGIGVSHLRVYDTPASDGVIGGSSHVHLVCSEGYFVISGRGAVQTLGPDGFDETPLKPGTVAWFTPGMIHRLVNGGDLEIVTLMQNGGLPEAGDAVLTFPDDVLADASRYRDAVSLDGPDPAARARRRRDLAIEGFEELRRRVEQDGADVALAPFYAHAHRLVSERLGAWRELWRDNAHRAAAATGEQIDALDSGDTSHLLQATLRVLHDPSERGRFGMCGTLDTYQREHAR